MCYVDSNPISGIDPFGLFKWLETLKDLSIGGYCYKFEQAKRDYQADTERLYEERLDRALQNRLRDIENCRCYEGQQWVACVEDAGREEVEEYEEARKRRREAIEDDPYTGTFSDYFCSLLPDTRLTPKRPSVPAPGTAP